jgi:hypothetical protein
MSSRVAAIAPRREVGPFRAGGGPRGLGQRLREPLWARPGTTRASATGRLMWPVQTPAHEARCPAVGNRLMSSGPPGERAAKLSAASRSTRPLNG